MKRLLSLIEKTGDRLVITDPAGEHPYVLMGLDHYEKLVVGEWKPETVKHDPTPPQALPLSTGFPDNKPPKREIPLWKSTPSTAQPHRPSGTSPLEKGRPEGLSVPAPAPVVPTPTKTAPYIAPTPEKTASEPEGEEQFYLEPLE